MSRQRASFSAGLLRRSASVHIERRDAPKPASLPSNSPLLPHPVGSSPLWTAPRLAAGSHAPQLTRGRTRQRGAHRAARIREGKPDARRATVRRHGSALSCARIHGALVSCALSRRAAPQCGPAFPRFSPGEFPMLTTGQHFHPSKLRATLHLAPPAACDRPARRRPEPS